MILKKSLVLALSITTAFSVAQAKSAAEASVTKVRIPVVVADANGDALKVGLAQVNKKLAAKGLKALPSYIEISTENQKEAYDNIQALKGVVQESLAALGYEDAGLANQYVPADLDAQQKVKTCYLGDGNKVADLFAAAADSIFSDQMSLLGYKYKSTTFVSGNFSGEELKEVEQQLNDGSEAWAKYDKRSSTVVILNSVGDDGTDVQESVITKCSGK